MVLMVTYYKNNYLVPSDSSECLDSSQMVNLYIYALPSSPRKGISDCNCCSWAVDNNCIEITIYVRRIYQL